MVQNEKRRLEKELESALHLESVLESKLKRIKQEIKRLEDKLAQT